MVLRPHPESNQSISARYGQRGSGLLEHGLVVVLVAVVGSVAVEMVGTGVSTKLASVEETVAAASGSKEEPDAAYMQDMGGPPPPKDYNDSEY